MKFVIQRVSQAQVQVENETRQIGVGYVILMGIGQDDTIETCDKWIDKILKLRLFADEHKPINASLQDVDGEILLISQFTLYADTKGQNRPSFIKAGKPEMAEKIYNHFAKVLQEKWPKTKTGEFGKDMQVSLTNDGPVTLILED